MVLVPYAGDIAKGQFSLKTFDFIGTLAHKGIHAQSQKVKLSTQLNYLIRAIVATLREIRENKPDIIHAH